MLTLGSVLAGNKRRGTIIGYGVAATGTSMEQSMVPLYLVFFDPPIKADNGDEIRIIGVSDDSIDKSTTPNSENNVT